MDPSTRGGGSRGVAPHWSPSFVSNLSPSSIPRPRADVELPIPDYSVVFITNTKDTYYLFLQPRLYLLRSTCKARSVGPMRSISHLNLGNGTLHATQARAASVEGGSGSSSKSRSTNPPFQEQYVVSKQNHTTPHVILRRVREQPDSCVSEPAEPAKPQPAAWQALVSLWNHASLASTADVNGDALVGWSGCARMPSQRHLPQATRAPHPNASSGAPRAWYGIAVPTQHPLKTAFRSRGRSWCLGVLGRGLGSAQARTTRGKTKTCLVRAAWTVDLHHPLRGPIIALLLSLQQ